MEGKKKNQNRFKQEKKYETITDFATNYYENNPDKSMYYLMELISVYDKQIFDYECHRYGNNHEAYFEGQKRIFENEKIIYKKLLYDIRNK